MLEGPSGLITGLRIIQKIGLYLYPQLKIKYFNFDLEFFDRARSFKFIGFALKYLTTKSM
jgi:hypothetical protein